MGRKSRAGVGRQAASQGRIFGKPTHGGRKRSRVSRVNDAAHPVGFHHPAEFGQIAGQHGHTGRQVFEKLVG